MVSLSLAVAQPPTRAGAVTTNALEHARAVRTAGARVVVFPEMSLTGYALDASPVSADGGDLDAIVDACAQSDVVALVGAPVRDGNKVFIATLRVDGSGVEIAYRKQMLGDSESTRFTRGPGPVVIDVDGWRIGLGICKDTGSAQHIAAVTALDVDVYAAGLVHRPDERAEQDARGTVIARACRSYVAFAGFAGATGGGFSETLGRSTIFSPDGEPLAQSGSTPGEVVAVRCTRNR